MGPVDLRVLACDPPATRVSSKNFQLSPLFSIICLQLLCFQYFALGMYRIDAYALDTETCYPKYDRAAN